MNIRQIPVDQIIVDHSYQRNLNRSVVAKMAASWDPVLCGVVHVAQVPGGLFSVVDGQHRVMAARAAGVAKITAIDEGALTRAEQARRFVQLNSERRQNNSLGLWKANVEAADPVVMAIVSECVARGITINLDQASKVKVTRSVVSLQEAYHAGVLGDVLTVCITAWPDDPHHLDGLVVRSVASFIRVYRGHPNFTVAELSDKLGSRTVRSLIQRRQAMAEGGAQGGGFDTAGRLAVLEAWNRGKRSRLLPAATMSDLRNLSLGKNPWVQR